MATRTVSQIVKSIRTLEGAGFLVRRPFPAETVDSFDPFLLIDEMGPSVYGPGEARGAPDHPHRGFETVTYLLDGEFEHRDSTGGRGSLKPGDVQWMTAGDGVLHSEMPSARIQRDGGRVHGFQIWINLPRKDKRMKPRYQELRASGIPVAERPGVRVRVIAGESLGTRAVGETRSPLLFLHATLQPGARLEQAIPPGFNALAFVFGGEARAGEQAGMHLDDGDAAFFASAGDTLELSVPASAKGPAEILILGGAPLREPVARYGPFVMNTRAELVEAFRDFESGKLGHIVPDVTERA